MTTVSNDSEKQDAIRTAEAYIRQELPALLPLVEEYERVVAEQSARRKEIQRLAFLFSIESGDPYLAIPDRLYIGPDVNNERWIYMLGNKSNQPRWQMERDGKRSPQRRPRLPQTPPKRKH